MSNEINLFENEIETVIVPKSKSIEIIIDEEADRKNALSDLLDKIQEDEASQQYEKEARIQIKRLIEALLFASNEPLPFNKIREVTDQLHPLKPRIIRDVIFELQHEYLSQQRGFRLEEIGQGYLLRTCEEMSSYIELLYRNKRTEKLTQAAAEVLAIIAYRQPITRPQIENIRGVDSSGVVTSLLERGLIQAVGKLEAPGRPTLYGITNEFLSHFGIKDVKELPIIEEPKTQEDTH